MYYDDLLGRANLYRLTNFLLEGSEYQREPEGETYRERIEAAESAMLELLQSKYSGRELDAACDAFYALTAQYESVYFEIGLLLGGRIALQISHRLREFSAPYPLDSPDFPPFGR